MTEFLSTSDEGDPSFRAPSKSEIEPARLRRWLTPRLLNWYEHNRRQLPWRWDRDPYRIWVSEVMLQQTQVRTVIPYFERWMAQFPTVADLAAAEEQTVLRQWEGLGYYRRARNLHRAAQILVAEHGGQLPDDPEVLRRLPGLGRYTTNAVLSQAYDRKLPILEANTQRLLSRLFARHDNPREVAAQRWLWWAAEELLPNQAVGEFNQALMELGALVCTPETPACQQCPLAARCLARQQGLQERLPVRSPSVAPTEVQEVAVVLRRDAEVLLVQRPKDAPRWAHLWEFPHGPLQQGEVPEQAAGRLLPQLTGLEAELGKQIALIRHGVTRFRITLTCYEAQYRMGMFRSDFYTHAVWLKPEELERYAVSSPQRRLARELTLPPKLRQARLF